MGLGGDIPQPKMWQLCEPKYKHCCLEIFFFKYDEIISTSKLPFHEPLVMKYCNVFSTFFLRL